MGILIEHYGGNMPLWLAPEQVRILPISEKTNDFAADVKAAVKAAGLSVTVDVSDDKVGAKIARAHADRVPYMLVVGPKEAADGAVNVRTRQSQETQTMPLDEFISTAAGKNADKCLDLAL